MNLIHVLSLTVSLLFVYLNNDVRVDKDKEFIVTILNNPNPSSIDVGKMF